MLSLQLSISFFKAGMGIFNPIMVSHIIITA